VRGAAVALCQSISCVQTAELESRFIMPCYVPSVGVAHLAAYGLADEGGFAARLALIRRYCESSFSCMDFIHNTASSQTKFYCIFSLSQQGGSKKKLSSYMLFAKAERPKVKKEMPDLSFGEVGKELGKRWRALSDKQKAEYK
jgi:hypothetical protein